MRNTFRVSFFLCLALFLSLQANAEPAKTVRVSDLNTLPFQLQGVGTFLPVERYEPLYFCRFDKTPVELPPEGGALWFQLLEGVQGISRDKRTGFYVTKKLALFQSGLPDGTRKTRPTQRIQTFSGKPVQDDWDKLRLVSDAQAKGSSSSRQTVLELDRNSDTGFLSLKLWKTSDRSQKPFFENTYTFRYAIVRN